MSKVCILSFPRYFNYGTFLQLYAMQVTVQAMGYQPEIIDYDPYNDSGRQAGSNRASIRFLHKLLFGIKGVLGIDKGEGFTVGKSGQMARFKRFLENDLALGDTTYFSARELEANPPEADAVIVGSDQVWHPVGHRKDPAYFLSFTERTKRVAYAPSFGVSEVPGDTINWLASHIQGIPHLSIREKAGADIIRQLTGREVPVVLDPAYLLDAREWGRFAGQERLITGNYMLCYFLESDQYMRETALRIAKERGLQPVMIPVHPGDTPDSSAAFTQLTDIGPHEYVQLIRDADFVCTDSFHGTSFSLLFERQFLTFKRYDNPDQAANHSRLDSILKATGLDSRVVGLENFAKAGNQDVDFTDASKTIAALRAESMSYLNDALSSAVGKGSNHVAGN